MDRAAGRGRGYNMDDSKTPLRHVAMYLDASGEEDNLVPATEQNYEDFCAGVMLYTRLFGMTDWHINFHWEDNDDTVAACVYYSYETRSATFVFGRRIDQFFRDSTPLMMKLALHETLHLLFAELGYVSAADNLTPTQKRDLMEIAEHSVIRRLENILLALPKLKSDDYLIHRLHDDAPKKSE